MKELNNQITIKDIAKLCGVGVSTVSRAINDHPDINEETKQKVLKVIKKYNYIPNSSARNLKLIDTKTIGILIKGINNPYFIKILIIFKQELSKRNYDFVIESVNQDESEIDVAIKFIKEKRPNGLIFLGGVFGQNQDLLKMLTVPFVLCTVPIPKEYNNIYSSVAIDDEKESYRIVDHLCKKGHKKIGILCASKTDESIGKLRLNGYKRALIDNDIEFDEKICYYMNENIEGYSMENGYAVMNDILKLEIAKEITAFFAIADSIAIGASSAIYNNGYVIPDDYSIAGFDGLDVSKFYNPCLTTIEQPAEKIAISTIKLIFELMKNPKKNRTIIFEGKFIEGESVKDIKGENK